ncbi:MAG: helix-turn-helix domain-containing protein [Actinobacteria bacterium]|nr:helix-turn-helix domain-containing protein [Actinomycetota bacterium]
MELRRLLDLYLSATWRLSEHFVRTVDAEVGSAWATPLFRASDDAAAALGDGYDRAQRRAIRREEAIRRELIDDLLAGVAVGESLRDLASHVGFNLAGVHQAIVARTDRAVRDAGPVQSHVERELLARHGDGGFVATKEALLVCVLAGSAASPGETVLRLVTAVEPGGWTIGVGRPHRGPVGVARSFREARAAIDMARQLALTEPVVAFHDLLPYRLLSQDRRLLRETVEEILGPLGAARGGAGPLIETLEAYFDEALNTTAAARRLHLSVRAVAYRLDRINELTGRSVGDGRDRFALELAVRGRRLLATADFLDPASDDPPVV